MANITERFQIVRERDLRKIFTPTNLSHVWRGIVKAQMRSLDIDDLYDYYDFSSRIDEKAKEICTQILKAQYKASNPLIYKVEKKYGVCRHIMIPAPSDALVFQTITEHLAPLLLKHQPSKNAYYSRDKSTLKLPHQFMEKRYPWFMLWPRYQKDILGFTNSCPYLVVTDLTNFFDNIGLRELRHIISSTTQVEEVLLDLLFSLIEQLSWLPDYLPTSLKGLPTINLEAFRLLPHAMLFEVDRVLNKQTQGNFARWNDDINFGVGSVNEAYLILGNINDVLKSRGLAINLSKTYIYSTNEAKTHFLFDENTFLDSVDSMNSSDPSFSKTKKEFIIRFRAHIKKTNLLNWDKVTKRYFTVAGHHKFRVLEKYVYRLYMDNPSIRDNIISYLYRLGFSKRIAQLIINLLVGVGRHDDVTLYQLCKLITELNIPRTSMGLKFIRNVRQELVKGKSEFDLYCYLTFLAKYGQPNVLMNLIEQSKNLWRNEQFLARQVVSLLPRALGLNRVIVKKLLDEQMTSGPRDAASVATSISALLNSDRISSYDKYLLQYLFPPKQQKPYPLSKYLILTTLLSSISLLPAERKRIIDKTKLNITDPWYLLWLNRYSLLN
jgi:hypothetical protein